MTPPLPVRIAVSLYRIVVLLYPPGTRRDVGPAMVECFREMAWVGWERRRWWGLVRAVARTLADVPTSLATAWRSAWTRDAHGAGPPWRDGVPPRPGRRTGTTRGSGPMTGWATDLLLAMRRTAREPGTTGVALLSLALGVAASSLAYTLVSRTLWTGLPVPEPERMVRVFQTDEGYTNASWPNFTELRDGSETVFRGVSATELERVALGTGRTTEVVSAQLVTPDFFRTLDLDPALGRLLDPYEDGAPEGPLVVVLAHDSWTSRFAADPEIVGRTVRLNGDAATVVGVAPEGFRGTEWGLVMDLWIPLQQRGWQAGWWESRARARGSRFLDVVARLRPEISMERAQAVLDGIGGGIREREGEAMTRLGFAVLPDARSAISPDAGPLLGIIAAAGMGAGLLVLLVACGNVAGVLLARGMVRRGEVGVRRALGAGPGRLLRPFLTEAGLLGVVGGITGWLLARGAAPLVRRVLPETGYRLAIDPTPPTEALLLAGGVALAGTLLAATVPALRAARGSPSHTLPGARGSERLRLLRAVVVGMVCLAFVSLTVAGLFLRSLDAVRAKDPGFRVEGRWMLTADAGLAGLDGSDAVAFQRELATRVEALPGVGTAAWTASLPLGDRAGTSRLYGTVGTEAGRSGGGDGGVDAWRSTASPGYFEAVGTRLLAGRGFQDSDATSGGPTPVVVNRELARRLWGDADPLGQRVRYAPTSEVALSVVGVVETGLYRRFDEAATPAFWLPATVTVSPLFDLVLRTDGPSTGLASTLREAVRETDPDVPVLRVRTVAAHLDLARWLFRFGAGAGTALGALALLLSMLGLYGVLAFVVRRRTREIGIRMALGAPSGRVVRGVLRSGYTLVVVGLAVGALAAAAVGGGLASLLVEVPARDPATLLGVAGLLCVVSLAACLGPALRATRIDPVRALREE